MAQYRSSLVADSVDEWRWRQVSEGQIKTGKDKIFSLGCCPRIYTHRLFLPISYSHIKCYVLSVHVYEHTHCRPLCEPLKFTSQSKSNAAN